MNWYLTTILQYADHPLRLLLMRCKPFSRNDVQISDTHQTNFYRGPSFELSLLKSLFCFGSEHLWHLSALSIKRQSCTKQQ